MTFLEYRNECLRVEIEIERKTHEIENLQNTRDSITGTLKDVCVQSSPLEQDKIGALTSQILDLVEELGECIVRKNYLREKFNDVLKELSDPKEYDLMYRHYVLFQPWKIISEMMNYSRQWLHVLHDKILHRFNDSLDIN